MEKLVLEIKDILKSEFNLIIEDEKASLLNSAYTLTEIDVLYLIYLILKMHNSSLQVVTKLRACTIEEIAQFTYINIKHKEKYD